LFDMLVACYSLYMWNKKLKQIFLCLGLQVNGFPKNWKHRPV
jgi:hypothetical protein